MTPHQVRQRKITLDAPAPAGRPPDQTQQDEITQEELRRLDAQLGRDVEYLPLEIYVHRFNIRLPEGATLDSERGRAIRACWKARRPVKKLSHPRLGVLPVFPVDVLTGVYSDDQPDPGGHGE